MKLKKATALAVASDCRQTRWKSSLSTVFFWVGAEMGAVDFRSRRFAFRGAGGEPPHRRWRLRGLTCPAEPAGVYAPSTPINRTYKLNVELNISLF